ncbi:kallikrein-1-like [Tubulanus polymorphus]|uniref:kallikrein-1-like n=1 Tax=Tubulanus polymorphus TaxID=672921 RepID=UPI003DA4CE15
MCGIAEIKVADSSLYKLLLFFFFDVRVIAVGNWRITGGTGAQIKFLPWQVSLRHHGRHICGGTLLDSTTVLTAAHCYALGASRDYSVAVGVTFNKNVPASLIHSVDKLIVHPNYRSPQTGYPERLHYTDVKIQSIESCRSAYRWKYPFASISYSNVCAGGDSRQSSCFGDSGGPLVCRRYGEYVLEGVVSWGPNPCGQIGVPAIFSRALWFKTWIKKYMNQ